jgi:hypothetical protein
MDFTVFINAGPWLAVPPPGYGGVENMLVYLIKELREQHGCRVILGTVEAVRSPSMGRSAGSRRASIGTSGRRTETR